MMDLDKKDNMMDLDKKDNMMDLDKKDNMMDLDKKDNMKNWGEKWAITAWNTETCQDKYHSWLYDTVVALQIMDHGMFYDMFLTWLCQAYDMLMTWLCQAYEGGFSATHWHSWG